MKEASYYETIEENKVKCVLCPRKCNLKPDQTGFCRVRRNIKGKLYSLVYERIIAANIDPIEKKPLFHFLPGKKVFSIGTVGCTLRCKHCQNYDTSQATPEEMPGKELKVEDVIKIAKENDCEIISYTYTEPTVFYEYMLDTAKLAKKQGIKNVMVTNGFIEQPPLKELLKYMDGFNVDLKYFNDQTYRKNSTAWLPPILETIKTIAKSDKWLEITNLIIPTINDDEKEIKEMCEWIKKNIGTRVPIHFTAFYPCYKLQDVPPTPLKSLEKAYEIAKGLKYIYIGNLRDPDKESTFCPKCGKKIIERQGYSIPKSNMEQGGCKFCKEKIDGLFNKEIFKHQ
jgi:pyruvate formate lyase activating enzyme